MDIDTWMNDLIGQLKTEFKERLVLVGLQGSRARGEQREDSDIDIVVVIEDLNADDLALYRSVIQKMPHAELACGFIGSPDVLAAGHDMMCSTWQTTLISDTVHSTSWTQNSPPRMQSLQLMRACPRSTTRFAIQQCSSQTCFQTYCKAA